MTAALTPAELTVLGLLVERPRHGWELEEVITERGMREWTEIGFSSIYYLLSRLRERGLIVQVESERPAHGKARRIHRATAEGRRACADAAETALAEPRPMFPPLLVGLAQQPTLSPERLRAALERRAAALADKVAEVTAGRDAKPDMPDFVRAIFDYSLHQLTAEQRWLADYRANLAAADASAGEDDPT